MTTTPEREALAAWQSSDYGRDAPHDAIHPMFLSAFTAGFAAAGGVQALIVGRAPILAEMTTPEREAAAAAFRQATGLSSIDWSSVSDRSWAEGYVCALLAATPPAAPAQALTDALKLQAQIWAQEAKTQQATVRAAYQACTGATGEPGDWNGAAPIRALVAERDALRSALEHIVGSCEGRAVEVARTALASQEGAAS